MAPSQTVSSGPLLVFGPRSPTYDFGANHPLTPRRFGPGIDLLRRVGAVPGLAPEPAADEDLLAIHAAAYLAAVRRFSADPGLAPAFGIAPSGDVPPFTGMHDAAAAVAGGSLRAMRAILDGTVEHAYHPGGGLHHAMPAGASGFCIYNDAALAVSAARLAGLRVLYLDFDVHHGDGVEAIHRDDPGVMTVSFHESGRYLFPGTGSADEIGDGDAAGTVVNVPFEPLTGETAWLAAVKALVPTLAAAFGPDVVVSQHGADSHAWDPLAHLRVTTTAMGEAARLVDAVAHRYAGGRWLATGGGGYEVYRVVPRAWALTWLAGAHREAPDAIPDEWRERWGTKAARRSDGPLPARFDDPPNAGFGRGPSQDAAALEALVTLERVRALVVPRLLVVAEARGWWDPARTTPVRSDDPAAGAGPTAADVRGSPTVIVLDAAALHRLRLAPRTIAPADPDQAMSILSQAVQAGSTAIGAVDGEVLVGVAVLVSEVAGRDVVGPSPEDELVALGVAPDWRRRGLAASLLDAVVADAEGRGVGLGVRICAGERDVVAPFAVATRLEIADRLLTRAGFARIPSTRVMDPGAAPVYRRT